MGKNIVVFFKLFQGVAFYIYKATKAVKVCQKIGAQ